MSLARTADARRTTEEERNDGGTREPNLISSMTDDTEQKERRMEAQKTEWKNKISGAVREVMNFRVFFTKEADYAFGTPICKLVTTRCKVDSMNTNEQQKWWDGTWREVFRQKHRKRRNQIQSDFANHIERKSFVVRSSVIVSWGGGTSDCGLWYRLGYQ